MSSGTFQDCFFLLSSPTPVFILHTRLLSWVDLESAKGSKSENIGKIWQYIAKLYDLKPSINILSICNCIIWGVYNSWEEESRGFVHFRIKAALLFFIKKMHWCRYFKKSLKWVKLIKNLSFFREPNNGQYYFLHLFIWKWPTLFGAKNKFFPNF